MSRLACFAVVLLMCSITVSSRSYSQGAGKYGTLPKVADSAQQKSWQQVDRINQDADKSQTRYQQAQQQSAGQVTPAPVTTSRTTAVQGAPAKPSKTGVTVKSTRIGKRGVYKRPSLKKQQELAREK